MGLVNDLMVNQLKTIEISNKLGEVSKQKQEANCFDKPDTPRCKVLDKFEEYYLDQQNKLQENQTESVKRFDFNG